MPPVQRFHKCQRNGGVVRGPPGCDHKRVSIDTALIIDDEPRIRGVVSNALADDFARVIEAGTGSEGLRLAASEHPSLIVLDLGLPDASGVAVCEEIRKSSDALILRRANVPRAVVGKTITNGDLKMDLESRTLFRNGAPVHLTPTEWDLLRVLMSNAGKTLTHRQLFSAVWAGRQFGDAQQYLRVHIANVRRKIETNPLDPKYIITEPGVGYRFATPAQQRP